MMYHKCFYKYIIVHVEAHVIVKESDIECARLTNLTLTHIRERTS